MKHNNHALISILSKVKEKKNISNSFYSDGSGLPQRIFYRGLSCDYGDTNNTASIFRTINRFQDQTNEYKYTNEYMRRFTAKFNSMNNNFSRLSYMQHYGLPTRLLDVTTNFSVALYFACQPNLNKYGEEQDGLVYIFLSNVNQETCDAPSYYTSSSDTVEILATLALMPEDKKSLIYNKIQEYVIKINDLDNNENWYEMYTGKMPKRQDFEEKYKKHIEAYQEINNSYDIQCLYHDIRKDSGHFSNTINFENLIHPFFVESAIDNPRIKAQSGFFLFEPYDGSRLSAEDIGKKINDSIVLKDKQEPLTIKIPKDDKKSILRDLDQLYDVNQATLFPDESNVAEYIKKNF